MSWKVEEWKIWEDSDMGDVNYTSLNSGRVSYMNSSCFAESRHFLQDKISLFSLHTFI